MSSLLIGLGVVIVAAVTAIVMGLMSWLFLDTLKATDLEAFRAIVSAFAGAFFAYLFVRFGDAMKKIYDRMEANHTALVMLQPYFNDCLNTTNDNIFIIDKCVEVFTEARLASAHAPIYMNNFCQYPINRDIIGNLTNMDFMNEVYSLNITLQKMNVSLTTIDRAYSQIRDAFIAKNIDDSSYQENARQYRDRNIEIRDFLVQLNDDLIRLFAITNLLLKDRPFMVSVILVLVRTSYPSDLSARLPFEQQRVAAEIETFAKASAQKIREVQGKTEDNEQNKKL